MRLNWTAHTLSVRGEATPHLCRHKDAPQWPARPNDDNPMRELAGKNIDTYVTFGFYTVKQISHCLAC